MKKIIYTIIIIITLACSAEAQWVSQPLPFGVDVYDMKFFDANTGLVAANDGWTSVPYLFRTTNGGNNWYTVRNTRIYQFHKINDSILYAYGRIVLGPDMILRTFDKGATWDSIPYSSVTFRGISFVNKDTGWVSGFDGGASKIWKTTNGGLSLTSTGSIGWGKIFFLKYKINGEYYGWCSEYGDMWKTTNSGVNWFVCGSAGNLQQLEMINERIGWASNASTNILRTTNGGLNWVNQPMPSGNGIVWRQIKNFRIIDSLTVFGDAGSKQFSNFKICGIIWKTTNGGLNWGYQQPDTSLIWGRYEGIDFINANTGWSSNIHTTNGGGPLIIVDVNNNISQTPKTFTLSQNYPNPFNPSTKIRFSVPMRSPSKAYGDDKVGVFGEGKVVLKVYDVMGREVQTLVNESLKPGTYEVTFNIESATEHRRTFGTGVYFYKLISNGFTETKKMLMIK